MKNERSHPETPSTHDVQRATHNRNAERKSVMKSYLAGACSMLVLLAIAGCGADPGGEFVNGDFAQTTIPISGPTQKIQQGYTLFKAGNFLGSEGVFRQVIADNPTPSDQAEALAGLGFSLVRQRGSSAGIPSFEQALELDARNSNARVGLGGALISRGSRADIERAVEVLQGIAPGNPEFTYVDAFGIGIRDPEVHALLAYALFVQGDRTNANNQAEIARSRDADLDDTATDQILEVLGFIP